MKNLIALTLAAFTASTAFAGSVTFVAPEVVMIEEPLAPGGNLGGSPETTVIDAPIVSITRPRELPCLDTPDVAVSGADCISK